MTDQRGIVLAVTLVMLLVLTLLGIAAVSLTSYEAKITGNERVYNDAFYAADGGIENFRAIVSTGEFVHTPSTGGTYSVAIGDCTSNITYQKGSRYNINGIDYVDFLVTSEGVSPNFPTAGRVVIQSVIAVNATAKEGYN